MLFLNDIVICDSPRICSVCGVPFGVRSRIIFVYDSLNGVVWIIIVVFGIFFVLHIRFKDCLCLCIGFLLRDMEFPIHCQGDSAAVLRDCRIPQRSEVARVDIFNAHEQILPVQRTVRYRWLLFFKHRSVIVFSDILDRNDLTVWPSFPFRHSALFRHQKSVHVQTRRNRCKQPALLQLFTPV